MTCSEPTRRSRANRGRRPPAIGLLGCIGFCTHRLVRRVADDADVRTERVVLTIRSACASADFVGECWYSASGDCVEESGERSGFTPVRHGLVGEFVDDGAWGEIELIEQERVGMGDLDLELGDAGWWEVAGVERDDCRGVGPTAAART